MRDIYVDVLLEVPVSELAVQSDPTRYLYEVMRLKADAMCAESGARLRTDRAPEVEVREGQHPITRQDVTLVASRWPVVAPDSLVTS
jgi:hypothetical protein